MNLKDIKSPLIKRFSLCLLALFFVIPTGAAADDLLVTGYLGYRVGGDFTDISTTTELELAESESYGLIIGKDNGTSNQTEFLYSIQPTQLKAAGPVTSGVLVDVDVENYMLAGKSILSRDSGTFVSGLVGVTRFDPNSSSLNSDTRFALGLGGGIDYRISNNLGFRFEGRGIATFLDSDGAVFCGSNGGCLVFTESNVLWQFEFITGFTFRF